MQDRANVSADFLELMRQEIIEVIKKYIDVDESAIDVRMTNRQNDDGTNGAPALYANIPILSIKDDVLREKNKNKETENKEQKNEESKKQDGKKEEVKAEKVEEASEKKENIEEKNTEIENNVESTVITKEKDEPKKEEEKETAKKD